MGEKTNPLISIITVTYNAAETIEETILSVINQSFDNFEFLIIDGGSTDDTINVIKKFQHKIDYWKSEPDSGIYDAMNKGVKSAKGEFIYFLGGDDLLFNSNVLGDLCSVLLDGKKYIMAMFFLKKEIQFMMGNLIL